MVDDDLVSLILQLSTVIINCTTTIVNSMVVSMGPVFNYNQSQMQCPCMHVCYHCILVHYSSMSIEQLVRGLAVTHKLLCHSNIDCCAIIIIAQQSVGNDALL